MDDLSWIWQTIVIFFIGRIILRIGGRKSISQMTITQVIVMVGIGSLLIQPIAGKNVWQTIAVAFLIVLMMIIIEYLEVKFDKIETLSTGKSKIVIEDGRLNMKNLKKMRMSVDRLETRLRQSGISSIEDIKYATVEVSGQLGYELKEDKKPMTKEDFNQIMNELTQIKKSMGLPITPPTNNNSTTNLFDEIKTKTYEGNNEP